MRVICVVLSATLTIAAAPASNIEQQYIRDHLRLTSIKEVSVDLNGDGRSELVVYADGPENCRSGGCDLYILTPSGEGYRQVMDASVSRLPIRLLKTSSHGWRDIGVMVAGGGITTAYEARLRFDGRNYPENPTVPPATALRHTEGQIILK